MPMLQTHILNTVCTPPAAALCAALAGHRSCFAKCAFSHPILQEMSCCPLPPREGEILSFLLFWGSLPDTAGCLWEWIFTQKNKWCMPDPPASSLEGNKHLQSVWAAPSTDGGTQLHACIKPHYPGVAESESQQQVRHIAAG